MFGFKYISHRPKTGFDFPSPDCLGEHFYPLKEVARASSDGRYLCVCKVDDIWQLHRSSYSKRDSARKDPYLLDLISAEIGDDLKSGRCFVLLDQSGEGHPFFKGSFDDIHDWCNSVGLNRSSVGFVTQNRALSEEYNKVFGPTGIHIFNYDWIINALAGMLQLSETGFQARFRFSKFASLPLRTDCFTHSFLCLNGTPRPIRVCTLAALSGAGILKRTRWSLLTKSSGKGSGKEVDIQALLRKLRKEDQLLPHALALIRGPEKTLDPIEIVNSNQLIWSIDYDLYKQTCVSVITETEYTEGQIVRITEKTIKALAMGRPLIVFGNPRSLDLVRGFGFQTFSPYIDETYDRIDCVATRFDASCAEIIRLDELLTHDAHSFIGPVAEVCAFNANHARSGDFLKSYKSCVVIPFWQALERELMMSAVASQ